MTVRFDQYAGIELRIDEIPIKAKITLASAKQDGKVTGYAVQKIQDIGGNKYQAKLNAGFFCDQRSSAIYGEAYGIRCGADEWSVPRQGKFVYYAIMKDGTTKVGMDYDFYLTPDVCRSASSPALILKHNGVDVEMISPSRPDRRTLACCQSVMIRTLSSWLFVISRGNLTPDQIKAWAKTVPNAQDIIFNDGGGSACFTDEDTVYLATGENRKIANAWAAEIPDEDPKPVTLPLTETPGLKGIDISNWQAGIDLNRVDYDFMIAKATEGIGYVDPYCDQFIQQAKARGKLWGFYHFARPTNDAIREADYFVNNCRNYFGEGLPVLDWEAENKNDVAWALRWLNRVKELTGVKPLIYMSESVVNAYDWSPVVSGDYGLWVAKYRDNIPDLNYDMTMAGSAPRVRWWSGYAMWQWTSVGHLDGYSGSLDCDVFYGDKNAWAAYVRSAAIMPGTDVNDDQGAEITALRDKIKELEATLDDLRKRVETAVNALKGD